MDTTTPPTSLIDARDALVATETTLQTARDERAAAVTAGVNAAVADIDTTNAAAKAGFLLTRQRRDAAGQALGTDQDEAIDATEGLQQEEDAWAAAQHAAQPANTNPANGTDQSQVIALLVQGQQQLQELLTAQRDELVVFQQALAGTPTSVRPGGAASARHDSIATTSYAINNLGTVSAREIKPNSGSTHSTRFRPGAHGHALLLQGGVLAHRMPPTRVDAVTMTINLEPAAGRGDTPPAADGDCSRHGGSACSGIGDGGDGAPGGSWVSLGASSSGDTTPCKVTPVFLNGVVSPETSGFSATPPACQCMPLPPPRATGPPRDTKGPPRDRAARGRGVRGWSPLTILAATSLQRCGVRTSEVPTHEVDGEAEMLPRVPTRRHHGVLPRSTPLLF